MVKDQEYLNSIASQTIEYSKKLGATDVNVEVVHSISETVNLRNKQLDESNRSDSRSSERNTKWSDATLQVLNNNNLVNFDVVFQSVFPVSLSTLPFDVTGTDNDYFTATATFRYTLYEVREKNSQVRR